MYEYSLFFLRPNWSETIRIELSLLIFRNTWTICVAGFDALRKERRTHRNVIEPVKWKTELRYWHANLLNNATKEGTRIRCTACPFSVRTKKCGKVHHAHSNSSRCIFEFSFFFQKTKIKYKNLNAFFLYYFIWFISNVQFFMSAVAFGILK